MIEILLVLLSIVFIFEDEIHSALNFIKSIDYIKLFKYYYSKIKNYRYVPLSEKIEVLENGERVNFIKKTYEDRNKVLNIIGEEKKRKQYNTLSIITGLIGFLIASYLKSIILIPILTIGFALLPMWITRLKAYKYRQKLNSELSVALSTITSTYIRTSNIVKAIEENIETIENPVKKPLEKFIYRYYFVDKDIIQNIKVLSKEIDSRIFHLWCQELVVCQQDFSHKDSLTAVVNQLSTDKEIQDNLSVKLNTPIKETLMIIFLSLLVFPVLYLFGNGALDKLLHTFTGQIISGGLCALDLITINKAINISEPVE